MTTSNDSINRRRLFPSIDTLARALRELAGTLDPGSLHDVHLKVTEEEGWEVAAGKGEGGPGWFAYTTIPGGKRFPSVDKAKALLAEAKSERANADVMAKEMRATLRAGKSVKRRRKGPFPLGEMVTAADGGVVGRVVGHSVLYTQTGVVRVHLVELQAPVFVPQLNLEVSILPIADALLSLAGSFHTHSDEHTPVMTPPPVNVRETMTPSNLISPLAHGKRAARGSTSPKTRMQH